METLARLDIWRFLIWSPKWILRLRYSNQRMADLLTVDLRPRHNPVTANLGTTPTYELWFQIINMSPFEVELDRAEIRFTCAGTSLDTRYIKRTTFKAGEIAEFQVQGDIPEGKANQIAQHHNNNASWISMDMDFNCKLHSFSKRSHRLEGVRTRFINHGSRVNK